MELLFLLLALIAGACAPTQAGINAQLRLWTGDAVLAAMISFAVGTMSLFVYTLVLRTPWPQVRTAGDLPWWMWTGGCLGAFLVAVTIMLVPKLGAATMMGFMIAGQMLAGLVLDHYGLIGYELRPMNEWRMLGAILLVAGVVIIKRF